MNSVAQATLPGRSLMLTRSVQAGDMLVVRGMQLHVVWAKGEGPCEAVFADPSPYAGMSWVVCPLMAGESVRVWRRVDGKYRLVGAEEAVS